MKASVLKTGKLLLCILLCQAAGLIGSFATRSSLSDWYLSLNKPVFNPPGWVFAPVWLTLYTLMGIALYLVWQKGITNKPVKTAIVIFFVQLALNTLWPFMFFGMRSTLAGLLCIIPLWAAIIVTAALFFRISRAAGWLLIPYLLWVSFAVILNFRIWQQN